MNKQKNKSVNIKLVLLYVAASLILLSALIYFMPLITHTEPYSKTTTNFSGFDFTKALFSNEESTKMFATKAFFEMENTKSVAYIIAIGAPVCFLYSIIVFVLTILSTYYKNLNNIFAVSGFFTVWVVLLICVIILVGKMGVTRGDLTINNYSIAFGTFVGAISVLSASTLNIFAKFIE